jgi:hypothetical protein
MNSSEVSIFLPTRKSISISTRKDTRTNIQLQPIISNLLQQQIAISPYTISTKFNIRKKYHT